MEMVRHDDERVQEELSMTAIVENGLLQQFCCGRDLEEAAALRGHSSHEVGPGFLGSDLHWASIDEEPVAKAT
jgi:hypothetical protein